MCAPAETGLMLRCHAPDLSLLLLLLLQHLPQGLRVALRPLHVRQGQALGRVESALMPQDLQNLLLGTSAQLLGQQQSLALTLAPLVLLRGVEHSLMQAYVLAQMLPMQALGRLPQAAAQLQMEQLQDSGCLLALDSRASVL